MADQNSRSQQGWETRRAEKQQQSTVRVEGLRACRVAAAITQRELAELIDSNQATLADLENWDEATPHMLQRLCLALKVDPEDLISRRSVEHPVSQGGPDLQTVGPSERERAERRRQVNLIKRRGYYADPGAGYLGNPPGTVLLRGLKDCRLASGLTQRELASMSGTKQATITELEKGTYRGAYMSTIQKLCRALGVSPADLICKGSIE